MDRLTDERIYCLMDNQYFAVLPKDKEARFELKNLESKKPNYGKLYMALAAYEETGLSPREILQLKSSVDEIRKEVDELYEKQDFVKLLHSKGKDIDYATKHIEELLDAEEQGRLVVLPCKECFSEAGNDVYLIYGGEVLEAVHCGLSICPVSGKPYVALGSDEEDFPCFDVEASEFGKTVFLTREEAEAALRKENGDGTDLQ